MIQFDQKYMNNNGLMKVIVTLTILVCVMIITIILFSASNTPKDKNDIQWPDANQSANALESYCLLSFNWATEARQMYDIEIETDVLMPNLSDYLDELSIQHKKSNIIIKGVLNFRVLGIPDEWKSNEQWDNIVMCGFQLSPVQVLLENKEEQVTKRMPQLEYLYETFFSVAFTKEGLPVYFYFPDTIDKINQTTLSELINCLQIYIPSEMERGIRLKWSTNESHFNGEFKTEYLVNKHDCQTIYKENVRCVSLPPILQFNEKVDQSHLSGYLVDSGFRGEIQQNNSWLTSLSGAQTFEIRLNTDTVFYRYRIGVMMRIRPFDPELSLYIWDNTLLPSDIIHQSIMVSKPSTDITQSLWPIEGQVPSQRTSLVQLFEDIKKAARSEKDQTDSDDLIYRLQSYLNEFPHEIRIIPDLIKNINLSSTDANVIFLALEVLPYRESKRALMEIILDQNQNIDIRMRAIVTCGGIVNPDRQFILDLIDTYQNERQNTNMESSERADAILLSLGILNETLQKNDKQDLSQMILNKLIQTLKETEDEWERVMCIKALSHSPVNDAINAVKPYMNSESLSEHQAAIQTLTFMLGSTISEITDPQETTEEIKTPKQILINLLKDHLSIETNSTFREYIILSFIQMGGEDMKAFFDDYLQDEPDESLRETILHFLNGVQ